MLKTNNLCAGYEKKEVIHNINYHFRKGKLTAIIGPNGSGKSTLLKALVKLINISHGEVNVSGINTSSLNTVQLARQIAYLPQNKQIPDITVLRMVLHGRFPYLNYPRHYRDIDYQIAEEALEHVNLIEYKDCNMTALSGGTQQKVLIAMTLAQSAPVILLDEPLSFLDISHQISLMELSMRLAEEGKAVVIVIHDLLMALKYCDEIIVMKDGEIALSGNPDEIYESGMLDEIFNIKLRKAVIDNTVHYYYQ